MNPPTLAREGVLLFHTVPSVSFLTLGAFSFGFKLRLWSRVAPASTCGWDFREGRVSFLGLSCPG
jgi:hypothetical protein